MVRISASCARASRAAPRRASSPGTSRPSARTCPFSSGETVKTTRVGPTVAAVGKSKGIARETMSWAVTMKMMSRTRVMSTSGVTLMPTMLSSLDACSAAPMSAPFQRKIGVRSAQVSEKQLRQCIGVAADDLDASLKVIERRHRGYRHGEADGGCHERFRDARHHLGGHGLMSVDARFTQAIERHDDADHRSEQADERRVVAERAQER